MKTIFIAGSYGSGTSAVAGVLDKLGVASLPPHFMTNDPLTPNSFESLAFRELVNEFADEASLRIDLDKADRFTRDLRALVRSAKPGPADAVMLKMPLASICLPQINDALDPYVILVHRPYDKIENSRLRRNWPAYMGEQGAFQIYSRLLDDLIQEKKSFLALSYDDLLSQSRREIMRITAFCGLRKLNNRIDTATRFLRRK